MAYCETYLNFIGGQWKQGSGGQWAESRNPAHPGQLLGKCTRSTPSDLSLAVEAASRAQPEWARQSRATRGQVLAKTALILRKQQENAAETLTREQGMNLGESRSEIQRAIQSLETLAAESRRAVGEVLPPEGPGCLAMTTRSALGIVAVISPSSSPYHFAARSQGAALLEGNTIVFKPSSSTSGCAVLLVRAFEEAGLPAGALNLVFGSGPLLAPTILAEPRIRALAFAGSRAAGQELRALAARRALRLRLEVTAENPFVILEDADLDAAAEAVVQSGLIGAGHGPTQTHRILVHERVLEEFRGKLLERVRAMRVGDGHADPSALGPLADVRKLETALALIERARLDGAEVLCGGERVSIGADSGCFLAPTILDRLPISSPWLREELPAPILALLPFPDPDPIAQSLFPEPAEGEGRPTLSIRTRDLARGLALAERVAFARVEINRPASRGDLSPASTRPGSRSAHSTAQETEVPETDFYCLKRSVLLY